MDRRRLIALLFAATALAAYLLMAVMAHALARQTGAAVGEAALHALIAGLALAALLAGVWLLVDRWVFRPAQRLDRAVRALLETRMADRDVPLPPDHALGGLPEAIRALSDALRLSRRDMRGAMEGATARVNEQKKRLEVILQGLSEGVIVCNRTHQILLYNQAAVRLLEAPDALGLGRPLFGVLTRAPVEHTLERLDWTQNDPATGPGAGGDGLSAPFVCSTPDARHLLQGRMALVPGPEDKAGSYVVTLVDISAQADTLSRLNDVRTALTRDLRGPLANLRAAAETVGDYPDMDPGERGQFLKVVESEAAGLSKRLESLAGSLRGLTVSPLPMADIFSPDLAACVARRLGDTDGLTLTLTGQPLWLHGDSLSLMTMLERLVRRLHDHTGHKAFDLEPLLSDKQVYLELSWPGGPVPAAVVDHWLSEPCGDSLTGQTLRDVLDRHGADLWSQPAARRGHSVLRLPLPAPRRAQFLPASEALPPRPEFYDFDLLRQHQGDADLASTPLSALTFVVFDTETTGLNPAGGDEVISLAGVRVVNGRVLTGESFERLINPGRPIPPDSIRFHGITDEDVRDKPPIAVVLPQFKAFLGEDAVLVAHNAAFDLTCLRLKEAEAGVSFRNPVLDTLLISAMLDPDEEDHTLDGLAERLNIAISARHTALGDSLATAEVLIHLLDRLQARGLTTFGEVMKASNMAGEMRQRESRMRLPADSRPPK